MTRAELWALFSMVRDYVYKSGGDGDGWIITRNVKNVAALFREWMDDTGQNPNGRPFPEEETSDISVDFCMEQESISITTRFDHSHIGRGDLVIGSIWLEDLKGDLK